MNDTWINIGSKAAVRLEIKQINGQRGIGVVRLIFTVELTNRDADLHGAHLPLRGRVEMLNVGGEGLSTYLADLTPFDRDATLGPMGTNDLVSYAAVVDDRQLQLVEEHRAGSLQLRVWFSGHAFLAGGVRSFNANNIDYQVPQSEWLNVLEQVGYARRFLVELEVPDVRTDPALSEAIGYFSDARRRFGEGDWRLTADG